MDNQEHLFLQQLLAEFREFFRDQINKSASANNKKELYYDSADIKQILNISESTLYRMRKQRSIPFFTIHGQFYYPVQKIKEMMDGGKN